MTCGLKIRFHICKISLSIHQLLAAAVRFSTRTFEFSALSREMRCICVTTLNQDLGHPLEVTGLVVSIWEVEVLYVSIQQLCILHPYFFFDWFFIRANNRSPIIVTVRSGPICFSPLLTIVLHHDRLPPSLDD